MAEMQTPPYQPGPPPTQPHRGVMILVFGILGIVCCIVFGILAWVFGNQDLQGMDQGRVDPSGRGLAQAGKILGIISVPWTVLWLIYYAVVGVAMFSKLSGGQFPR
jgi:uncharacterized BrkB/YihY/UPF0761 family membrane protein